MANNSSDELNTQGVLGSPRHRSGDTPFFARPRPPLQLVASDSIADDSIRLTYVPA